MRIGFIFQQFNLVSRLTLFTNAALGSLGRIGFWRGLLGTWPGETSAAAMAALARVGIADYAGQRAGTLSGGQQQRGAIARALVQQARVILADEPVASLDPVAGPPGHGDPARSQRPGRPDRAGHPPSGGLRAALLRSGPGAEGRARSPMMAPPSGLDRARLVDIYGPEFEDAHA